MRYPSWSDYATGDQSDAPHLHRNLWAAWMPMLGATGSTLFDVGPRNFPAAANNRTNATDWVTKQFSSAYFQEANATGRFIPPLSSSLLGQGEATISCWVWLVATPATTAAIYQDTATGLTGARFGLLWVNTGNIQFQMRDPYTQRSLTPLTASVTTDTYGRWSHWCATYSAAQATINLYRDGVSVRTAANSGDIIRSTSAYGIGIGGRISSAAAEASNDLYLADLRLWNRALSGEEVRELGSSPGAGFRRRSVLSRVAISLGGETITGSGSATTDASVCSASGVQEFSGDCSVAGEASAAIAFGVYTVDGSASAVAANDASTASGEMQISGASSANLDDALSLFLGELQYLGSVAVPASDSLPVAFGAVAIAGTAAPVTDSATSTASGGDGTIGSCAVQLNGDFSAATCEVAISGTVAAQTSAAAVSSGFVACIGSSTSSAADCFGSSTGFVGFLGSAAVSTSCDSAAAGVVTVVGVAIVSSDSASSSAAGSIPTAGTAAVILDSATMLAAGVLIQTDLELVAQVTVSHCNAAISAPLTNAAVKQSVLRGRKIWQ